MAISLEKDHPLSLPQSRSGMCGPIGRSEVQTIITKAIITITIECVCGENLRRELNGGDGKLLSLLYSQTQKQTLALRKETTFLSLYVLPYPPCQPSTGGSCVQEH